MKVLSLQFVGSLQEAHLLLFHTVLKANTVYSL